MSLTKQKLNKYLTEKLVKKVTINIPKNKLYTIMTEDNISKRCAVSRVIRAYIKRFLPNKCEFRLSYYMTVHNKKDDYTFYVKKRYDKRVEQPTLLRIGFLRSRGESQ